MNRKHFTESTRSILIHLREYNYKLCRKGLLERIRGMKVIYSESKTVENLIIGKSLQCVKGATHRNDMIDGIHNEELKGMTSETERLATAIKSLQKTIVNIRDEVKSRINGRIYNMWWNRVDNISQCWKKTYSDINNELYNHLYKVSRIQLNGWNSIIRNIGWIEENVFVEIDDISELIEGFEEGDLSNLFSTGTKCKQTTLSAGTEQQLKLKRSIDTYDNKSDSHEVKKSKFELKESSRSGTCKDGKADQSDQSSASNPNDQSFASNPNDQSDQSSVSNSNANSKADQRDGVDMNRHSASEVLQSDSSDTNQNQDRTSASKMDHLKQSGLEEISSEDEGEIINNTLAGENVDQVGEVDLNGFENLIEEFLR